jgi:acid stress-induced BolA-like protein IbaG/YrbA
MKASEIKAIIEAGLPDANVEVNGDDGQHFDAVVVSPSFSGKSLIEQHKMVKATLGDRFTSGELHALGLKTAAPK